MRQFEDDLAKIAHSVAVVPGFVASLLFANPMALRKGETRTRAHQRMRPEERSGVGTYMNWSSVTYNPAPISWLAPLVPFAVLDVGPRPNKSRIPSALTGFSICPFWAQKAAVSCVATSERDDASVRSGTGWSDVRCWCRASR